MKKHKDTESMADSIGINLNSHLNFGVSNPPSALTPIIYHQSSPEDVLDNIEKKV